MTNISDQKLTQFLEGNLSDAEASELAHLIDQQPHLGRRLNELALEFLGIDEDEFDVAGESNHAELAAAAARPGAPEFEAFIRDQVKRSLETQPWTISGSGQAALSSLLAIGGERKVELLRPSDESWNGYEGLGEQATHWVCSQLIVLQFAYDLELGQLTVSGLPQGWELLTIYLIAFVHVGQRIALKLEVSSAADNVLTVKAAQAPPGGRPNGPGELRAPAADPYGDRAFTNRYFSTQCDPSGSHWILRHWMGKSRGIVACEAHYRTPQGEVSRCTTLVPVQIKQDLPGWSQDEAVTLPWPPDHPNELTAFVLRSVEREDVVCLPRSRWEHVLAEHKFHALAAFPGSDPTQAVVAVPELLADELRKGGNLSWVLDVGKTES